MTGRVGVCDATVGPGAAKLPSGLAEALGASVPVIALVSDLPTRMAPHRYRSAASQALDQAALLAPVTKWLASVPDAASMPGLVRQAFREATSGRPPAEPVPPRAASERFGAFPSFRPAPEPDDVAAVAQVLRRAARPFLLAGGGVMHSGAGPAVAALATRLSAAVGTTLTGKGAIAEDHPLSVGVTGTMGTSAAAAALAEADVVLLAGTKASGGAPPGGGRPAGGAQHAQRPPPPGLAAPARRPASRPARHRSGRAWPRVRGRGGHARGRAGGPDGAAGRARDRHPGRQRQRDRDQPGQRSGARPQRLAGPAGRADTRMAYRTGHRAGQRRRPDRPAAGAGRA